MNEKLNYLDIGFDDSEIISFKSQKEDLILYLKIWNDNVLEFKFRNCILFLTFKNWCIADFYEIKDSIQFQKSLKIEYDKVPINHEFKLFNFISNSDDLAIEIACHDLEIKKVMTEIS